MPKTQTKKHQARKGLGSMAGMLRVLSQHQSLRRVTPRHNVAAAVAKKQQNRGMGLTNRSAMRYRFNNPHLDQYYLALTNPFSRMAVGVKLPEPYAVPTVSYKITMPLAIYSDANGNWDAVSVPHLLVSAYSTYPSTGSGVGLTGGASQTYPTTANATGFTTAVAQEYFNAATTATDLAAKFFNYRIVATGARFKPNVSYTNASGRIYGAVVPSMAQVPLVMTTGSIASQLASDLGVPLGSDGHISNQIVNLPDGFEYSMAECLPNGGKQFLLRISSAASTDFIDGANLTSEQNLVVAGAGGIISNNVGVTYGQSGGFSSVILKGEGCAASTQVGVFEVIYHLEGTPIQDATTGPSLQPGSAVKALATSAEVGKVLKAVASEPIEKDVAAVVKATEKGGVVAGAKEAGKELLEAMSNKTP